MTFANQYYKSIFNSTTQDVSRQTSEDVVKLKFMNHEAWNVFNDPNLEFIRQGCEISG